MPYISECEYQGLINDLVKEQENHANIIKELKRWVTVRYNNPDEMLDKIDDLQQKYGYRNYTPAPIIDADQNQRDHHVKYIRPTKEELDKKFPYKRNARLREG